MILALGLALYLGNVTIGLLAQFFGRRFGVWHHVLYAAVFAGAIAATVAAFHPALVVTLAALAVFPRARPRTPWHPALAAIGLVGYVLALIA